MKSQMTKTTKSNFVYAFFVLVIFATSIVDAWFSIKYPVTIFTEENPIAWYILLVSDNDMPLLMLIKAIGTGLVVAFLSIYYYYDRSKALTVAFCLVIFQLWLLCYILR